MRKPNRHRSDLDETVTQSRLLLPTSFLLLPPTRAARILFIMCQIYVEYFQFGSRCRSQGGILFTQEKSKCEASETFKMRQFTRHSTISQTVYHTPNEEEEAASAKKDTQHMLGSGKEGGREWEKSQKSVRKPGKCLHKLRCSTPPPTRRHI